MLERSVISLSDEREKRQPHARGRARCFDCKHEWEAVAPIGVYWFECPQCSALKGKYIFMFNFPDELHWICACGNDLFHMLKDCCVCPNCGETQKGF